MKLKSVAASLLFCTIAILCGIGEFTSIEEAEPFRMRKVNLVWLKAKKIGLSKERLNELFVELQRQDKDERKWKHKKAEGHDKDGEMEATIRQNLVRIMDKYGLGEQSEPSPNSSDKLFDLETNRVKKSPHLRDGRLDKLWQAAVDEGQFDKHELEELRKELDHHHEKWKEYNTLIGLVSEHEEKNQNVVGKKDQNNEDILIKLREEMNIKQKEIETNYRQLKMKVVKGPGEEDFQDHRVKDLWKRAKAQILSEDELAVMKEELKHFDHKIAKHDHLQEQLDVAEELLNQGHDHIKQKHEKLTSKVKEHRRWIKKMHVTLLNKIGPHNEL